ncbi:hypothetical protein BHE74_00027620, partial [Ensete ventricosum]
ISTVYPVYNFHGRTPPSSSHPLLPTQPLERVVRCVRYRFLEVVDRLPTKGVSSAIVGRYAFLDLFSCSSFPRSRVSIPVLLV